LTYVQSLMSERCSDPRVIREILSRRDPSGFYVILAFREAEDVLNDLREGVEVEVVGDLAIVRTRSRSLAEKIVRRLASARLFKC